MTNKGSVQDFYNLIKTIVDNYMNSRKTADIVLGSYDGQRILVGELPVPMSMVTGNMKSRLLPGNQVRLMRGDRGHEYFILEIIGRPYELEVR